MNLPQKIFLHEVGPREGLQMIREPIATANKIRLVDLLSECNFPEIEFTSFVSPKLVPQMADAEQVAAGITRRPGTEYTAIFLNNAGMDRAIATGRLDFHGTLFATASETFSKRNTNRDTEETFRYCGERIAAYRERGIAIDTISIMAAFGCNYEGDIDPAHVLGLIRRLLTMARDHDLPIGLIQLADTMGWATPTSVRRLVGNLREAWPDLRINLHLHDTRGLGLANAFAAMELGVDDFDSAVGGLGGCPFAGFKGAAGNIVTEDLVHLCNELGVATGIDLERLVEAARQIEELLDQALPGKVLRGGTLGAFRAQAGR